MTHHPNPVRTAATLVLLMAGAQAVQAQSASPLVRSDAIELKRISALAAVQRLQVGARAEFSPQVSFSQPGEKGCTFNIGDVDSARRQDALGPTATPLQRRGLGRTEYITLVNASPVCVQR
jgi:hypothetical protein